jgi:(R,R)-butanediol dehydrogenase/meso-butanediol dehydrogenase/diacetyl reductase
MRTMRAAVFHGPGDIRIEAVALPEPGAGELLIKVSAVGICGTDAHEFRNGPAQFPIGDRHPVTGHLGPLIPGHEPSGVVVDVGADVGGFQVGDEVASGATTPCGRCEKCRQGRGTICVQVSAVGVHRDGALAEYAVVPAITCRRLAPYGLPVEVGALAQPMAIAVHAVERGRLRVGEHAVLIGAGGIGAFACYVAVAVGARVTVVDRKPERLELARGLGAHEVVDAGTEDLVPGQADVVYEMTGTGPGLASAMQAVADGGRVVQVGLHHEPRSVELLRLTLKEIELLGTNSLGLYPDLHVALQLLAGRPDGWRDLAPDLIPLEQLVDEGIRPMLDGTARRVKTLIDPSEHALRELPVRIGAAAGGSR